MRVVTIIHQHQHHCVHFGKGKVRPTPDSPFDACLRFCFMEHDDSLVPRGSHPTTYPPPPPSLLPKPGHNGYHSNL